MNADQHDQSPAEIPVGLILPSDNEQAQETMRLAMEDEYNRMRATAYHRTARYPATGGTGGIRDALPGLTPPNWRK